MLLTVLEVRSRGWLINSNMFLEATEYLVLGYPDETSLSSRAFDESEKRNGVSSFHMEDNILDTEGVRALGTMVVLPFPLGSAPICQY